MAPASFTTEVGCFGDDGIGFAIGLDQIQMAEDQELLHFAEIQLVDSMLSRQ